MRILTIIFYFFLTSCPASAKEFVNKENFEVTRFGLYETNIIGLENLSSPPNVKLNLTNNFKHLKSTTEVPSSLGTRFGIEYLVHTKNMDRIELDFIWTPSTPVFGKTGEIYQEFKYSKIKATNKLQYSGYMLNIESELIPKSWELQIYNQGTLLHKKIFYVKPLLNAI